MRSIMYRITGLVFLLLASAVFGLSYLMDRQMTQLFETYIMSHHMRGMYGGMMGLPEMTFITSIHKTVLWVGLLILVLGLIASYLLARSITVPLRKLNLAAQQIEQGHFGEKVDIQSEDEVGRLAEAFNKMTVTLGENNRLRQRLLADIAHELKTPLAVIQGHLEGMLEGVIERSNEQISSLYDETTQLNRLIRDLRDLTLAEARQLSLDKQPLDVNLAISRILQMLKPLAEEKQIALQSELRPIAPVLADAGRFNQILYNILTNALRYTPEQGVVTVSTRETIRDSRAWIEICIADTGVGIAEEDLPQIFNHFYRADPSRNRRSGGSGIGLAIVKQLVEIHGGQIEVQSKVGEGSRFLVYMPPVKS